MLAKVTETPAGKVGVAVVAAVAVAVAIFVGIHVSSGGDSQSASDKDVKAAAQKQIDVINSNPNIPPLLKQQMIANQQGLLQGKSPASQAAGGPPQSGPPGASQGG